MWRVNWSSSYYHLLLYSAGCMPLLVLDSTSLFFVFCRPCCQFHVIHPAHRWSYSWSFEVLRSPNKNSSLPFTCQIWLPANTIAILKYFPSHLWLGFFDLFQWWYPKDFSGSLSSFRLHHIYLQVIYDILKAFRLWCISIYLFFNT